MALVIQNSEVEKCSNEYKECYENINREVDIYKDPWLELGKFIFEYSEFEVLCWYKDLLNEISDKTIYLLNDIQGDIFANLEELINDKIAIYKIDVNERILPLLVTINSPASSPEIEKLPFGAAETKF